MTFCGLDLAGSPRRPSGIAAIAYEKGEAVLLEATILYEDEEILAHILSLNPRVVAIDAPLSLPPEGEWFRRVDLEMKKKGYPVLPPGWKGMKALTLRAIKMKKKLEEQGVKVVETHPKSSLKSSNCENIFKLLNQTSIKHSITQKPGRDIEDAIIASITALFYHQGKTYMIKTVDGEIHLLPRICT